MMYAVCSRRMFPSFQSLLLTAKGPNLQRQNKRYALCKRGEAADTILCPQRIYTLLLKEISFNALRALSHWTFLLRLHIPDYGFTYPGARLGSQDMPITNAGTALLNRLQRTNGSQVQIQLPFLKIVVLFLSPSQSRLAKSIRFIWYNVLLLSNDCDYWSNLRKE